MKTDRHGSSATLGKLRQECQEFEVSYIKSLSQKVNNEKKQHTFLKCTSLSFFKESKSLKAKEQCFPTLRMQEIVKFPITFTCQNRSHELKIQLSWWITSSVLVNKALGLINSTA